MKKRILSLLLALLMLFSMFPAYSAYAVETEKEVTVRYFNSVSEAMEEADTVELYRGGELHLSAILREDISGDVQWQIEANQDFWVDIQGGTAENLRVSYGMVQGLLNGNAVRMRCFVSGDEEYYSDPVTVAVTDVDNRLVADTYNIKRAPATPEPPLPAPVGVPNETESVTTEETESAATEGTESAITGETQPAATEETEPVTTEETEPAATEGTAAVADESMPLTTVMLLSSVNTTSTGIQNEDVTYHTVTIEYVYAESSQLSGQRVALSYIAEVAAGDTLKETVASPSCVGYQPDILSIDLAEYGAITENKSITVEYFPAEVSYTVRHYLQNVDDDEYTWVDTTMATGYTEALTSDDAANTYTGFTALSHYHEAIAADSSTMIDIYYDRNYYLMSFDLGGGYGVDPIYARYGASISVGTPYKAGWNFGGWNGTIPSTMPNANKTYTASWTAQSGIAFTVAYWLEDANTEGKYNFWGSTTQTADAGVTVTGETYKDYSAIADSLDTYEKRYSYFDHADTDVAIKGDGSTVVNVYYNRKEYTLKFYYAARTGSEGAYTYKIYGGSTYFFGASNSNDYNGNELDLLNAIYTDGSYDHQWGEITAAPELNVLGAGRNYATGADTKNGVDYLYLAFSAKYGADISALWPCNVFESATRSNGNNNSGWSGAEAFVSAWNGEHHVCYSQLHSGASGTVDDNQTIKGNYNELDYQLLWDYDKFGDSNTVAYLCFWENGSGGVSWNVPELYRYNIYVPVLTGQEPNQTDDRKHYLWATYDTCDNSTLSQQTAPAINGYTYTGTYTSEVLHKYTGATPDKDVVYNKDESPILYDDNGKLIYKEAYVVNFFYSRDQYKLTFVNGDTTAQESMVYFDADISAMAPTVTYFDSNLADLYQFGGWYTSPNTLDGSEFDLADAAMPASALTLYAKWNLITHNVSIYLTEDGAENGKNQIGSTIAVTHDGPVPEGSHPATSTLKHPTDETATFIGWFYKDGNGDEQAFDFATMTITQDMAIYAKWRSNVMKQVEVYYVVGDENGNPTQIADTETLMLRLGQTRTFEAKTGSSLYADYRAGCFPTTASHSITITDADIASTAPVTFTFEYKKYGSVPYQVEFYVLDKNGVKRPAFKQDDSGKAVFVEYGQWSSDYTAYIEQHWQNNKAVVTELYVPDNLAVSTWTLPDAYLPNALKIQKIIVPSNKGGVDPEKDINANTIQFVYTYTEPENPDDPDNPVYESRYLVQHFIQNASDTTQYDLYSYSDETGLSGETAAASPISIPGYTYSDDVTDRNKQTGTKLDQETNAMTGTITADDKLELNFYYTVNSYPYQVMYLEQDTNRELATAKTTDSDGKLLTGLYGARVTEEAITIDGYDIVGASGKTIYIQMEAGATASVNTIVFYYKRKSAELVLSKSVELDATQAAQEGISELPSWVYDQEFVFTIDQPDGFPKSVYHYTFTDAEDHSEERTVNAGVRTIEIRLKHGEKVQFHDFPMGTYTVTEAYVPGFKATVGGYIAQAHTVTLETDGEVGELNFVNTFPFYTGDLVIKKNVTKLDENDPTATEPYKVTVVLNPDDSTREVDRVITWTDGDENKTAKAFTVPKLSDTYTQRQFTFEVYVPVGGEVKLESVPVGTFTVTEEVKGTVGYIYDYYIIKYNKAVHENDEVTGTSHTVTGSIHGGHPTAVTFHNTYKKGGLTINKTVTQEYVHDSWTSDTFRFTITGATELPDGTYHITVGGAASTVTVKDGALTLTGEISVSKTDGADSWSGSLTFENLPAGYYTVTETAGLGNDKYTAVVPERSLLVNDTTTATAANFTNTYKRHCFDLTITTACADASQSFLFTVSGTPDDKALYGETISLEVALVGNDSQTIKDLPVGRYTVTEQTKWSWREADVASQTVELRTKSEAVPFDFEVIDRIFWLSDYSYNCHKKGGG